jgi:hypothetical protein
VTWIPGHFQGDDKMRKSTCLLAAAALLAISGPVFAQGKGNCFNKAAEGTNTDEAGAKFQAYEAILQSFDWGAWSSWMSNKTTPGYKITTTRQRCTKGAGLGVTCVLQAKICKT